ncbi:isoleucyl-tRNA synthetase [Escherichia coli]|uniref:Isoleucyl-tRNA synthetase n=1 Tax=Escherichia coli TaxID=562 RepID=A0A377CYB6_ECOLX|nr:isoleucyl-tRNA synthetase [Escherichia coli]
MRGEVNKVIEQGACRQESGGSLEAAVTLYAEPELAGETDRAGR